MCHLIFTTVDVIILPILGMSKLKFRRGVNNLSEVAQINMLELRLKKVFFLTSRDHAVNRFTILVI